MSEFLESISASLRALNGMNPSDVERKLQLGEAFAFTRVSTRLKDIQGLIAPFDGVDLSILPQSSLQQVEQLLKNVIEAVNQVVSFDAAQPNARNNWDSIDASFESLYHSLFQTLIPVIALKAALGRGEPESVKKALDEIENIKSGLSDSLGSSKASADEAKLLLQSIKDVAAEQGVSRYAAVFKEQSDVHETVARRWLIATILLILVTGVVSVGFMFSGGSNTGILESTASAAFWLANKGLIIGLLVLSVFASMRNYAAHRHNAVVNQHRQNALQTYTAIVGATSGSDARDIVLSQVAQAIYGPSDSGYNKHPEVSANVLSVLNPSGRIS